MRSSYIRPVRLYLIASVAFFVIAGVLTQHVAGPIVAGDEVKIRIDERGQDGGSGLERRFAEKAEQWTKLAPEARSQLLVKGAFDYAPKVMFLLLPLFALLTMLLYSRRRQPYAAHFIFALHYHALVFFVALAAVVTRSRWVAIPLAVYALAYLPLALTRVFGGRWWATLLRVVSLWVLQGAAQLVAIAMLALAVVLL